MSEEQKTLVIHIDWWLWRVIAMSWAITERAKLQPVKVVTSRPLVFRWNPYIKSVHGLDDRRLYEDVIKWNDYIELEPYTDPKFFNEWVNRLEIAREKLWLEKIAEPILFLAEHEKYNNVLCDNCKPILFQPFGSTMLQNGSDKSYRSIPVDKAQYLANKLTERWFTPYVVEREDQPKLQWCQQLTVQDMRWLITLCDRYPVLWCDSALHHAVKAFWKKAVVVRAGTDAERYGYESNINLREYPCIHTPLRLSMNDFNFDISNQHTNQFSNKFLDKVLNQTFLLFDSKK